MTFDLAVWEGEPPATDEAQQHGLVCYDPQSEHLCPADGAGAREFGSAGVGHHFRKWFGSR